ncbi:MAG TPA: type IX secretion system outer membrane channel protein PorV [Cyclobacteriaceae bacterium]|nr:type IX secretion system outer membrane channel protein PorV [Cyclobacteriaceae bacterium]HMV07408.1 type IX secretion system outer membrane channel protein PorV [Cyclobacteriaceae bacterium]HMV88988.1 type IX secretion system outer membrane channel protein PorV [Cyclobacteriaceae bacterium]HMW99237.1 type IX secretion system outer membrane channel protein PorV [Cyclobacteriaceae bacterium]HMX48974.1 type IX secretion system outer membrane channel protein PorV [Cyclobacteriaceae bacterium]
MKFVLIVVGVLFCANVALGQTILGADDKFRPITTAVPFLLITPDARHAALGDAGVASSPDANSTYWNPAKLTFIESPYGASFAYTPWLGKITNDMSIFYLNGYYKITREQTVALSMKYFDMGDFFARSNNNVDEGTFHPRDFSFDLTYSRLLTENLSVGLSGRFIHSNLLGQYNGSSIIDAKPGNSVAADIGIFYFTELKGAKTNTLSLGAVISNIGPKLSNSNDNNRSPLPTNLRVGGAYKIDLDPYNSFTFLLDFNKLMVPSPQLQGDTLMIIPNKSLISGMFSSFTDAPDGFSEEIKEIIVNTGVEYWYNNTFAGRVGYFSEAKLKGNRKYMTIGLGFKKNKFAFDIAYLVPTNKREHPLAETIRFGVLFQMPAKAREDTVTD